jgi:hypothetical protein
VRAFVQLRDLLASNKTLGSRLEDVRDVDAPCPLGPGEPKELPRQGHDFLVLRAPIVINDLAALCRSVCVPGYASGIALELAWALGSAAK